VAGARANAAHHHQRSSPVVGHLYVNDNSAHANTIAGYDRHADGGKLLLAVDAGVRPDLGSARRL
jgi:hypothetical protein